jgi:hypothetical protein
MNDILTIQPGETAEEYRARLVSILNREDLITSAYRVLYQLRSFFSAYNLNPDSVFLSVKKDAMPGFDMYKLNPTKSVSKTLETLTNLIHVHFLLTSTEPRFGVNSTGIHRMLTHLEDALYEISRIPDEDTDFLLSQVRHQLFELDMLDFEENIHVLQSEYSRLFGERKEEPLF